MSDIKRYDIGHSDRSGSYKDEEPDGEYVEWEDHASAISAKDSKIAELEELVESCVITLDAYDIEATALDDARLYVTGQQQAQPVDAEPFTSKEVDAIIEALEPSTPSEEGREPIPDCCQGENCGTRTADHSPECISETERDIQEWVKSSQSSGYSVQPIMWLNGETLDYELSHEPWMDESTDWMALMTVAQHERIAKQLREEAATAKARQDHAEAARDVLAERRRQVEAEGWTPEHDDAHGRGAMALAAGCYARHAHQSSNWHGRVPESWPWGSSWWKPKTARENLVRAGALIIAEIERIDRAAKLKEQRDD